MPNACWLTLTPTCACRVGCLGAVLARFEDLPRDRWLDRDGTAEAVRDVVVPAGGTRGGRVGSPSPPVRVAAKSDCGVGWRRGTVPAPATEGSGVDMERT